jgi:ubiquinone biosynthesis protein
MVTGRAERYREIAEVLVRFGWGTAAERIGLRARVPSFAGIVERYRARRGRRGADGGDGGGGGGGGAGPVGPGNGAEADAVSGPEGLRRAFEELGPTFIKLGQMLATRSDIVPPEYARELSRLQDEITPVDFEDIRAVIQAEFGAGPDELYAEFSEQPLAVASIGQAHRARLLSGEEVVVKVRKPGVLKQVETDLAILRELADVLTREWDAAVDLGIPALVESFDRSLRHELDYTNEAANAERFRQNLADDPAVFIPAVHEDLSGARVLTEQFVGGMRIDDTDALDAAGVDRPALADAATRTIVQMVLVDGFFHADPHPGNLFVREDHNLWLIDFGMVGELDDQLRADILLLVLALGNHDVEGVMRRLLRIAPPRTTIDRRRLHSEVLRLMDTVGGSNLADMSMIDFFSQFMGMVRHQRLELPGEVSTLLRMLVLTESTAVVLDPEFHLGRVLREVGTDALFDDLGLRQLIQRAGSKGLRGLEIAADLPERGLRLLDEFEANGLRARLDAEDLEPLVERIESTADRLIAGITMGSLLVSIGGVVATGKGRAGRFRDPIMLVAGGTAALLGTYITAGAGFARTGRRFIKRLRP